MWNKAFQSLAIVLLLANFGFGQQVTRWDFGTDDEVPLVSHGNVQRNQAGPRAPEFPDLAADNMAVRVDAGAFFSVPDLGVNSPFDFTNDDAITIEAWVNPAEIRNGQPVYIVGKGRTGSPKFARDNQNWALRVIGQDGNVHISFLFATKLTSAGKHWHRWTSTKGFPMATGWHHIGVSYRFGDPESVRGWVNGQATDGKWDMGGKSKEPPVVDDDEIRIGNSFNGMIDAVAIHRAALSDKEMQSRFHRVGAARIAKLQPEVMPDLANIPEGAVLVQLCEGLPVKDRWLNEGEQWPAESARWIGDEFLLPRIPLQYDAWGIRTSWQAPVLLRMAADVELPTGTHQFLLRAREQGRLWIDGKIIARTDPITKGPPDGEEPVIPVAEPPLPGLRPHGYNQQEVLGEATIEPKRGESKRHSRVVLEIVVGGGGHRTETGEVCVAILTADGDSYDIVGADSRRLPMTDASIEPVLVRIEKSLSQFDNNRRRAAAVSHDEFWQTRHDQARLWAENHPITEPFSSGQSSFVDAFITDKIDRAVAASIDTDPAKAKHFHDRVLPILRDNCFRCHGEKDKGGLRLSSREAALKRGDSDTPAVVPGDVEASELIVQIRDGAMPPTEEGLSESQIALLEQWVREGASWPAPPIDRDQVALAPVISDEAFLRRIYLDTIGLPPSELDAVTFLSDTADDKRERLIDRLLNDERMADRWMSFWLDLLAENPSLLNASLNSTGPFRWFLYDSMRDNMPLDRMVTDLIMLRGGAAEGGSAGFGLAGENDAPFAAKGHILASAFLGIELQCARCHDSPYHSTTQEDLYSLAAMMNRSAVTVPSTSRVPDAFFENQTVRESLIQVTLKPEQPVQPQWPFASVTGVEDGPEIDRLMQSPKDSRERLAALITSPQNQRFSRVVANRVWKELIGAGFVEPVDDWEGNAPSHPELLDWLAQELITHNYDFRHLVRRIVTSNAYQRDAVGQNLSATAELRFFNAPQRRRLTAEQIVDSMHYATGNSIDIEELTFVHDGRRPLGSRQTLGRPSRAWMFGDLKNERDRPSLSLPKARAVVDVLEAFGWTGARQMPISQRESDPNVLQPGVLANGTLSATLTRASYDNELARLAIAATSPESLVDTLFIRVLSRWPKPDERDEFVSALENGFTDRVIPADQVTPIERLPPLPQVTWFNHLRPQANEIQLEMERRTRAGPPADPRLQPAWREIYEDVVWSLINHREFVWVP